MDAEKTSDVFDTALEFSESVLVGKAPIES